MTEHVGRRGTSVITPMGPDDSNYIFNSWLRAFQEASINDGIPARTYFRAQGALISQLLKDDATTVIVARSPVDELIIRGYVVAGTGELHWVNVKSRWRCDGLGRAMIAAAGDPKSYTHPREPGAAWLRGMGMTYDPRLFGGKTRERTT